MKNRLKNRYLQTIGCTAIVLSLVRCAFPGIAGSLATSPAASAPSETAEADTLKVKSVSEAASPGTAYLLPAYGKSASTRYVAEGRQYHRIVSVANYNEAFPDSNHVQLEAAQYWGVPPVKNRADAEARMEELVYIGGSPYYDVAHLNASIPYLVPHAALLLDDIGRNFFDSLQVKGVPLRRFIVSSVLRTEEDVERLRRFNPNATEQSCHLYGTTFDINYNLFSVVHDPDGPHRDDVNETRLKQILSEVLDDLRQQGRCYVKHEIVQPCFHITVR